MGDGGVACVPSQHVMEKFSICGGKTNGNTKLNSSSKSSLRMSPKMKGKKERGGELGLKNISRDKEVENNCNGEVCSNSKDEVEEGELGTFPIENGEFVPEKSERKHEIKGEFEKSEFVTPRWRKGGGELDRDGWRSSKDELEKGEFVPDRWRRSEFEFRGDDYGYSKSRRYDSSKEKGWKFAHERTPPYSKEKGWKVDREHEWISHSRKERGWKGDHGWSPPSSKEKGWKGDCEREWTPPSSGKYSVGKEFNRSGETQTHAKKSTSRYEADRNMRIGSKVVDEEGFCKNDLNNGKNHARGNRPKRYGNDSDCIDRKYRGECDFYYNSKIRKLSDDGSRSTHSSEYYSGRFVERQSKTATSSSRNIPSERYSSRHLESYRAVSDRHNSSPRHPERSPRDRPCNRNNKKRSPARPDRSPYDRRHQYERSRSPYDRSHYYDHRYQSPSYVEQSSHDQGRSYDGKSRTSTLLEQSPFDHGRSCDRRETNWRSGSSEKQLNYYERKEQEPKHNQKDSGGKNSRVSAKESQDKSNLDIENGSNDKTGSHASHLEELSESPTLKGKESPLENGATEELTSMEEDMDICNTPPHVSVIADAATGKWYYLDHFGLERGPSKLSDLKTLVQEGYLVSDHLIKHFDSDRWVTVEKAVSPLVTADFLSIVSDKVSQLVNPPEAPGNLLADKGNWALSGSLAGEASMALSSDPISFSDDNSAVSEHLEDLHIDERIGMLLQGVELLPGKELETVAEVLQMTFRSAEWERAGNIEDFTWCQLHIGEQSEEKSGNGSYGITEFSLEDTADSSSIMLTPSKKDNAFAYIDTGEWFSGQWSCKGGDWKRNEEISQDRSWKRKLVLNNGYPLCQMPKSGHEDPRWQQKDDLYLPSQSKRLDLPPWAFTSPDELNETISASRQSQTKSASARGLKGIMLPVIRINACVVKDYGSFVSEPRMKGRGKEKYSSSSSRPYSVIGETKSLSEDGHSKSWNEQDLQGSWKSSTSFGVPNNRLCRADELQLHMGDWYYLDAAGHEKGPLSFSELQVLADQGVIEKHSSVFRKHDKIWVPITSTAKVPEPAGKFENDNTMASTDTSGTSLSESMAISGGSHIVSAKFHDLHPQFIGYSRGKLHELVMKSYKSREFAAAINEFLDPWINARQLKKEMDNHTYLSDHFRPSKRARAEGSEVEDEMEEDTSTFMKDKCTFDDLCSNVTFCIGDEADSEIERGSWDLLDGHVLARVFHFLSADLKSLFNASLTCKHWQSVVKFYKNISKQVDFLAIAPYCTDAMILKIMNNYNKEKITSLFLRGCTGITSRTLEEVLWSFPCLSSIDIRGCSQLEDLVCKFPNINWVRSRAHSKIRSLTHITDKSSSASKTYCGLDSKMEDSSGLKEYLESLDKRDSANQFFRRSLYKRSKLFDARKSSTILSRDAQLRRLAMKKFENGYKRMEKFIVLSLRDIMKENTFEFFEPKVAEIENRMKNGYYASRGLNYIKEDISRMCRDAIKVKNRGDSRDMNRIITLFIRLAMSLEKGFKLSHERDVIMKSWKDDSPPGFSSTSSKYKKNSSRVSDRKYLHRNNSSPFINGVSDYGDYVSDREIRRRLSKLNKKSMDSGSDTSDDLDKSSGESMTYSESSGSDVESDLELRSEGGTGETRGDTYFTPDDGFDSWADEREWGARMTKSGLVPPVTRKYEVIDHYVIVADEDEVKRKMQVSLPDDYAEKLKAQRNGTEESDMEIPEVKEYKPRKFLGDEVIEQEVYGIDPYTHNLLLDSMPEESDWSLTDKHLFIEDVLLCTLNKQARHFTGTGNTPMIYPLKPVFQEILENGEEENDRRTVRLCQFILKAIDGRSEDNYVAYRKGLGVVCNKEGGFSEDDFVVEFLGEVYPAWKWFEKQDGIRSLQKNNEDPALEFYNIYLERPKGDADGYDLVVVDAMHKANYASRICHSCRPNCEAKVTAVDGQYQIGIYSVRPIAYGEEISFDYNSVTESKEEYEASVCLCGSQVCRGSYLNLTGEGAFQKVIKEYHGVLDRHRLMLEACELDFVSEEDYIDLGKAGLGSCLLGGLPDWLIAYSARLVRFINFERTKLPDVILRHTIEEKKKYFADVSLEIERSDAEVQAEGVYNQRLQNLALTLDKVRYVMRCVFGDPKKAPPPLERLSPEAAVSYVWKGESSVVEELIQCMAPHMEDGMLRDLKAKVRAHDPSGSGDLEMELRKSLLWLRDVVRSLPCTYRCRHDAAADLIHIYAYTKCFFRIREYKTITSPPVYISPLDLGPKYADKLGPGIHEYCKTYNETYCLGQLIFWHNQANAEPNALLAQASRGSLSLPDVGSFYAKLQKPSHRRVYVPRTLKFMLARMEKQPQRPWPKDWIWSFKNSPRVVGSPMLDAVLQEAPVDKEMIHWLKLRPPIFPAM
ncbi:histone-lysine N-methyltransferase ATXR3-like [Olea europaea var. sylvestris]|uniref:histone-lysine N-methyltransferase ATXR3-like n=1 Tax=Olea europaea var. sylvestris TaxID=158386 RepID=UPI000C1D0D76|nr:histone-lysine N-methyltransferase ATXR3-like [Olea europaea var. sylvestris]